MADLSTTYLGLELKNPLILGACGLTATPEGVRKAAEGGFGAVVLKSLFEEQLNAEIASIASSLDFAHGEAGQFLSRAGAEEGLADYTTLIRGAKEAGIPVIASLNCAGQAKWGDFAGRIAEAGASAIELNVGFMASSTTENADSVEQRLYALVREAKSHTDLPLAVKLGSSWSSFAHVAAELARLGVAGLVLFNRFYSLDLDLNTMKPIPGHVRSSGDEYHDSLRWISVLYERVALDFAASSGVHNAEAALKLVAAGAKAVQLCSVVYKSGYPVATEMAMAMKVRLKQLGYADIKSLRGRFAQWKSEDPAAHLRLQYIKALTGIE